MVFEVVNHRCVFYCTPSLSFGGMNQFEPHLKSSCEVTKW